MVHKARLSLSIRNKIISNSPIYDCTKADDCDATEYQVDTEIFKSLKKTLKSLLYNYSINELFHLHHYRYGVMFYIYTLLLE